MTINIKGQLLDFSTPRVMGILNATPDSFFDGGKLSDLPSVIQRVEQMLMEGASIIDIGGMSSRPGAEIISIEEELKRVIPVLNEVIRFFPSAIISVDTIRAEVAKQALQSGAAIINDITSGRFDENMLSVVAKHKVPFVLMHMQGLPSDMQKSPSYENVTMEVADFFADRISVCQEVGVTDIILDVGFGFGKTVEHNYTLLKNLSYFSDWNFPLMAGVSRKSMICKVLGVVPKDALNGTTAANMIALQNGANILRVHDVKEAVECVKIFEQLSKLKS